MKQVLCSTALIGALTISTLITADAATMKQVRFESQGQTLVGNLFLPNNYQQGQKLPAVLVTGAWTTVKEQMPNTYAAKLADRGYIALTFDFRGWGESKDDIKYLEDPTRKTEDILAAVDYLVTREEVDASAVAGLGICASAGYMSDAVASNSNFKSLALVAPWLHDAEIVNAVYGGAETVEHLISVGRDAAQNPNSVILEAASMTNKQSLMYQAPYYTETDRGLIPEYDNKFNAASWEGWLTYDALKTAPKQPRPVVLVHSDAAAIPQGAKKYALLAGDNAKLIMLDNVTQFDFYDRPDVVETSISAVAAHFGKTLK